MSRRPHPEWEVQTGLFLPPSSAAPRALAEEEPLGCLQQEPHFSSKPKREGAPEQCLGTIQLTHDRLWL